MSHRNLIVLVFLLGGIIPFISYRAGYEYAQSTKTPCVTLNGAEGVNGGGRGGDVTICGKNALAEYRQSILSHIQTTQVPGQGAAVYSVGSGGN
jgi:hypothetical protein